MGGDQVALSVLNQKLLYQELSIDTYGTTV